MTSLGVIPMRLPASMTVRWMLWLWSPAEAVLPGWVRDEGRHPRMSFRQSGLLDLGAEIERMRKIAAGEQVRKAIVNVR